MEKTKIPVGDTMILYFPSQLNNKIAIDPACNTWYSKVLFAAKEPVLFNSYSGQDIYRFIWLRSFHNPVIISLQETGKDIWITLKQLDRDPGEPVPKLKQVKFPPTNWKMGDLVEKESKEIVTLDTAVIISNQHAKLKINRKKRITRKEMNHFKQLLLNCSFWDLQPQKDELGIDGSQWIMEVSLKDKYWFVDRWSPQGCYQKCGEYLISLSGLKEPIY